MPSKRTLTSSSPLDTVEARKVLASIKRDLRRVKRDVEALQPVYPRDLRDPISEEPELPIGWETEQADA
jgi:hypothetical protein